MPRFVLQQTDIPHETNSSSWAHAPRHLPCVFERGRSALLWLHGQDHQRMVPPAPRNNTAIFYQTWLCRRYSDNGERLGTYNGHNGMVTSVDVSHDTSILASGAADGEARLWDVRTGACTRVLKHSSKVTSVAFSLGSQYLLTTNDPWKGASLRTPAVKYFNILLRHPHVDPSVRRCCHNERRGV